MKVLRAVMWMRYKHAELEFIGNSKATTIWAIIQVDASLENVILENAWGHIEISS